MNFILIIISLILSFFVKPAYAVDSSSIGNMDINSNIYVESGTPIYSISSSPIISDSPTFQDSTEKRQPSSLKNELEPVYEINEKVEIELFNSDANQIQAVLTNDKNQEIITQVDQNNNQGVTTLTISPPQQLKPGKYTIEIIDQTGSKIKQDFLWGVLAINPNKSIYNPGETANLAMAVLNELGEMVCDAKLTLKITDPDEKKTELSTENNKIIINQIECNSSAFTLKPDYETSFLTSKSGKYLMELTSETKNGIYTINDSFEVQSNIGFEVERISATRIYPLNIYPMTINIKANQDFIGNIYEEIPSGFKLIDSDKESIKYTVDNIDQNIKKIKWSVDLKKGEFISLHYQYKAPSISPQFYLVGPLQLSNDTDVLYQEPRSWQIASDAVTETFTAVGTTSWTAPTGVFSVHVQAWGAGGGGGDGANKEAGGGGGGGAFVAGTMPVTPGNSYDIVVGAGGSGAITGNGNAGGDSTFNSTTFIAKGGAGGLSTGIGGSGGLASASVGTTKYNGGKGGNYNTTDDSGGGGGGAAGPHGIGISGGNATTAIGGSGGRGDNGSGGAGGAGGNGGVGANGTANALGGGGGGGGDNGSRGGAGGAPGGGGGGGEVNLATSMGANGQVILTYTANASPNAPTLVLPTNSATGVTLNPTLKMVTTDSESNPLQYKIILGTDAAFTGTTQVFDQTVSNVGWSAQNVGTSAYSSGTTAAYIIQSNLEYSTMYYWKSQAKDYSGSTAWSALSIGYSFTTMSAPQYAPNIPTLSLPTTGTSGVSLTPTFKTVTTDTNNDNLQYEVKVCNNSDMVTGCQTFTAANVGWSAADVGTSSYSSGTTATYIIQVGNSLAEGTTYYWKTRAIDPAGSNTWSSTQTTAYTFVTNSKPNLPTLSSPSTGTTDVSLTPSLSTVATDPNTDNLQYKIELCSNLAMSVGCTTYDQTSNNTGWSGQDVGTSAYSSGTNATYIIQSNLAVGTSFFWRSYAIDYNGVNRWSSTQGTPNSFVTTSAIANDLPIIPELISPGSTAPFFIGITYPSHIGTSKPYKIVSADFNRDGYDDLATAYNNGFVNVFLSLGNGTFDTGTTYPGYSQMWGLASGDFNNDGYPDLVSPSSNAFELSVYLNQGNGTFADRSSYFINSFTFGVTVDDFNNDGYNDIAGINSKSDSVFILPNLGNATFGTGTTFLNIGVTDGSIEEIASGDINDDDYSDLVVTNYTSHNISVFINQGNDTFGVATTYPTFGMYPRDAAIVDLDNDGINDVVSANASSSTRSVTVFLSNGDGTLNVGTSYPLPNSGAWGITPIDINGDGKIDIATADAASNTISVLINQGSGIFGSPTDYPNPGSFNHSIASGDFNGDKKPDLATCQRDSNNFTIHLNSSSNNLSLTPTFKTVTTDPDSDDLQYQIKYCTDTAMSVGCSTFTAANVGWSAADVGTSSYSSGTTAAYVLQVGNSLTEATAYYWQSQAIDPSGTNTWSDAQTTPFTFTTGARPRIPNLISPITGSTNVSLTPSLIINADDPNYDNLQYKIQLCSNSAMSVGCTIYDQTSSNVGWSGQDVGTSAYSSGKNATYIIQSNLAIGTTFYWRSYAKDYSGINQWSSTQSTPNYFVTRPPIPVLSQTVYRWSADDSSGESRSAGVGDTWYDENYNYRVPINITNNVGSSLVDYQIGFTLNTNTPIGDSKMQNDCDDLRFTILDKQTTMPYWIESGCNSASTRIWIKIPTLAASAGTTLYAYYGNTAAAIASDGDSTFDGFDDFKESSLDTDKWHDWNPNSWPNSSIGVSNDNLIISGPDTGGLQYNRGIISNNTFTFSNHIIEMKDKWVNTGAINTNTYYQSQGIRIFTLYSPIAEDLGGTRPGSEYFFSYRRFNGIFNIEEHKYQFVKIINGTYSEPTTFTLNDDNPSSYIYQKYTWASGLIQKGQKSTDGLNYTNLWSAVSDTSIGLPASVYWGVGIRAKQGSDGVITENVDWIRIRKYASTEPTKSVGIETTIPAGGSSGATWLAAENVGITNVNIDSNVRLRFSIANTGDSDTFNFRLQVAPKGESAGCTGVPSANFSDVPTSVGSAVAVMTTSPNFTNQEATTNQLTDSSTTFVVGNMVEHSSNQTNDITLAANEFTEVEYNFQMTSNAGSTTPYCFRVVDIASTLNTYTQVAGITTTTLAAANEAPSAPFLPYVNNTTANSGQQTPVYGLIDHTPAFSAVFDDPNTSNTSSYYQVQIGTDSDWASAETWDSTKTSMTSCNENSRCADIIYNGGTALNDGSTYYWRIKFWDNSDTEGSWSDTQQFSMNSPPSVSSVVINGNNSIDLTENSSVGISWVATATDADSYTNLSSATGKIYRSGLGSTCTLDNNNCYTDASCDFYNCSSNSCSVLCSANLYFFTESTDVGSTYADQYYQAWVEATDIRTEVGSTVSSSTTIDVNTMSAFSIGSSLVYGEVFAGSDTGSSNTITTITNTGNSLINLEITGDYMCTDYPSCGGQSIDPTNQQYNLSTFNYGTGTTLTTAPQVVNIGISKPTQSPSNSLKNIYWGIGIPSLKEPGSYQGAVTILVD